MIRATFPAWHTHPDAWALMGAIELGYLLMVWRHRTASGTPTPRRQVLLFTAGVAVLWLASDWPIHDLAEKYLYMAHMVQHLLITLVAAPLLVLGTPAWLARDVLRRTHLMPAVKFLCRPVPGLIQFNLILVLSHWPVIVDGTLRNHPLHFVAHAALLVSALLMWMVVYSPLPWRSH